MAPQGLIVRAARAGEVEVAEIQLPAGSRTSMLTLDELEMMFIAAGELKMIRDDRLFAAPSACLRRLDIATPLIATRSTRLVCVRVPTNFRGSDPDRIRSLDSIVPMQDSSHEDFRRLQRALAVSSPASSTILEALALLITAWGESSIATTRDAAGRPSWLGKVIETLSNPTEMPRLETLAREAGVTSGRLARAFRDAEGCSVGEYQRRVRVAFACRLLHQERSSLSQVSLASGFADQAHFSRVFKRQTGMTPGEYRSATRKSPVDRALHLNFDPTGVYPLRSRTADGRPYEGVLEVSATPSGFSAILRTSVMPDVVADMVAVNGRSMILTAAVPAGLAVVRLRFLQGQVEGEWRLAGRPTSISGNKDLSRPGGAR